MLKKFIKSYYNLFDSKIKNGTLVIFIVSLIIIIVGFLSNNQSLNHLKASISNINLF